VNRGTAHEERREEEKGKRRLSRHGRVEEEEDVFRNKRLRRRKCKQEQVQMQIAHGPFRFLSPLPKVPTGSPEMALATGLHCLN
jgi:hypothetical protein